MKLYGSDLYVCDSCGGESKTRTYALGSRGAACKCQKIVTICQTCKEELINLLKDESDVRRGRSG